MVTDAMPGTNSGSVPGRPTRRRFVVMIMLFVIVVINYLDRANISLTGPQLSNALHLNAVSMGFIFSGFGWTYAALQVPASWFVDRVHPRFLYGAALALWSLGTAMIGVANSFAMVLALRLAIGAFEAPAYPINNRVVTTWFGEDERCGAIGFYTSGQFVGLAFLTPALSWLEVTYGWRSVFWVTGILGLIWAIVWFSLYRDPADFPGVNQAEIELIAAGGGIPDLSKRLDTRSSGFLWPDLKVVLGRRKLWGMYVGQFGLVSTLWFFLTWFPTYLIQFRHLDFMTAGLLSSFPFMGAFVGVLTGGFLSDWMLRRGATLTIARKTPIVLGLLLATVILAANYTQSSFWITVFLTAAFFGTGLASVTWSLVSAIAPERLIGLTGGVFNFVANLSAIVVPIVIGYLATDRSFAKPLMFVACMALMGALSYILVVGRVERLEA
jgi:MFS transporter, ACS family, D-galactonate transporter